MRLRRVRDLRVKGVNNAVMGAFLVMLRHAAATMVARRGAWPPGSVVAVGRRSGCCRIGPGMHPVSGLRACPYSRTDADCLQAAWFLAAWRVRPSRRGLAIHAH